MKSFIIKNLIKFAERVLINHYGELNYQYLYEKFYFISLKGKNIYPGETLNNGEILVMNKIRHNCNSNAVIFDVGANVGKYRLELAKGFNLDQKIYSFEPSKFSYNELKFRTDSIKNIHCYNIGMSQKKEEKFLFYDKEKSELSSLYKRDIEIKLEIEEKVNLTTIDLFCKENNIDRIDFLKLDVEGHEIAVLKGCENMINKINFIQFEFGGCNISSRTFFKDFYEILSPYFEISRILKDGLYPIKSYNEILECYLQQNFLATKSK